jgi:hypothetical protein
MVDPVAVPDPAKGVPAKFRTGVALASLVAGILALILAFGGYQAIPFALLAIALGGVGWWATTQNPHLQGRYQAIAGVLIGVLALVTAILAGAGILERERSCYRDSGYTVCTDD